MTVVAFLLVAVLADVQVTTSPPGPPDPGLPSAAAVDVQPSSGSATLVVFNRPIVELRARVLGRGPDERVAAAERVIHELLAKGVTRPVEWHPFSGGALVTVGSRAVVGVTAHDVDEVIGERVDTVAAQTAARLQRALDEAAEARAPALLIRSSLLAILALFVGGLTLWGILWSRRRTAAKLAVVAEAAVSRLGLGDREALQASRLIEIERAIVALLAAVAGSIVAYATITFVLRRFPYTRPWGESMREFLLTTAQALSLGVADAIPGLFTVAVILVIARFVVRLVGLWFGAVERGSVSPRWIYPETALPTRRLVSALIWVCAAIVAYPYLPGSQTEAFKGVSVFLGLMLTFGSSGLVNQVMSGFMITFSRALRLGDFVRIADVEGTVTHLGVLSTKIKTNRNEDVTIPNAVVVSQTTVDYSRFADTDGVYTATSVTIGYDAPWRQVQALLLAAAARTPGLRQDRNAFVLQSALEDFYVKYTLLVSLERQQARARTLHALHANIQDLFNEYGVQIMSPHYEADPTGRKVVAREDWFAAPAANKPGS